MMTPAGLLGGIAHMLFHSMMKITLFLCAGAVMHVTGKEYIYELDGLGRKMPVTFTCFTISALSLSGIPPLCGFVSKWRLLTAATEEASAAAWIGAGMLLCAAFLCTIYVLSICVRAFFPANRGVKAETGCTVREADRRMLLPICAFTAAVVLFGIWQTPVMNWLSGIANGLY